MKKRTAFMNILLLSSLMIFALWFALRKDAHEVIALLSDMHVGWFLFVIMLGIVYYVLAGYNIQIIAKRYRSDYRFKEGVTCAFACALFNGITPLGCGQAAQSYTLRKQNISLRDGAGIIWMDFIVYQSVILIYVIVLLLLRFSYYFTEYSHWFLLVLLGFCINSFVIVVLYTMLSLPKFYDWISHQVIKLGVRVHLIKHPEQTRCKWDTQLECFREQIKCMKEDKKLVLRLVLVQVIRMSIFYSIPFFAAYALHIPVELSQMLDIIAMSSFVHMLNALTPLPGDAGWSESAFLVLFAIVFPWSGASAVMLLWRFSTFHLILILGAILFIPLVRKRNVKIV